MRLGPGSHRAGIPTERSADDAARALAARRQSLAEVVAFGSGALCATLALVAAVVVLRFRPDLASHIQSVVGLGAPVLEVPPDILAEFREQRAVIDNVTGLTPQLEHETILIQPDADLEYVLRPLVRLSVSMLEATGDMNFDPPVLYRRSGTSLSESAQQWVRSHSRMELTYTTDERAHRATVPVVDSDRRILIVGDSVAFGLGVNDEDTVASRLQHMLGTSARVINAGIGGYDGDQAFLTAEKLSRTEQYATLVYIACQNDFESTEQVRPLLERFKTIAARFDGHVIVVLETYLQYNARDVLLAQGWPAADIALTSGLRVRFAEETSALAFRYADWSDIVEEYGRSLRSVLGPFALYADHCHLSPTGARLMAERIQALLGR